MVLLGIPEEKLLKYSPKKFKALMDVHTEMKSGSQKQGSAPMGFIDEIF